MNVDQTPGSGLGSFRDMGFEFFLRLFLLGLNLFLRWRISFIYTPLSCWFGDRWCGWDVRNWTIWICRLVVIVAISGAGLLGLHAGKSIIIHSCSRWVASHVMNVKEYKVAKPSADIKSALLLELPEVFGTGEISDWWGWNNMNFEKELSCISESWKVRGTYCHLEWSRFWPLTL